VSNAAAAGAQITGLLSLRGKLAKKRLIPDLQRDLAKKESKREVS